MQGSKNKMYGFCERAFSWKGFNFQYLFQWISYMILVMNVIKYFSCLTYRYEQYVDDKYKDFLRNQGKADTVRF